MLKWLRWSTLKLSLPCVKNNNNKKVLKWHWMDKMVPCVKVCAANCTRGLMCYPGTQGPQWALLHPSRRQTGPVSTECRKKLLSGWKGGCRLQTGYSLSKNIAAGRKSSANGDGATPDEGQHRLSLQNSKNQRTLSPQTENSPTLLKTAKEKKKKKETK